MNPDFDFSLLLPKDTVKIEGLEIPKYGSLTPYEIRQMQEVQAENKIDYECAIAAILLRSRCNAPDDFDAAKAPIAITRQIYDFAMNELKEWKIEVEDSEKKEPIGENSTGDLEPTTPMPNSGDAQST